MNAGRCNRRLLRVGNVTYVTKARSRDCVRVREPFGRGARLEDGLRFMDKAVTRPLCKMEEAYVHGRLRTQNRGLESKTKTLGSGDAGTSASDSLRTSNQLFFVQFPQVR